MTPKQRYRSSAKGKMTEAAYRVRTRDSRLAKERIRHATPMAKRRQRIASLKYYHGVTIEWWEALFNSQERKCAVCKSDDPADGKGRWHTDHNHDTGEIRGILCANCNKALGHAKDDPSRLRMLAEYLEERKICPMPAFKLEQGRPTDS